MVKDLNDPTNRDSVPAMLTPGEYVLNKEATNMFGPQIHAMNQAGLHQRHAENQAVQGYNMGGFVDFLKEKEGWRDTAYKDSAGVWTIGYGRTTNADGSSIRPNQTTTRESEDKWLSNRAKHDWDATKSYMDSHGYDVNDNQLAALASFRYNGGHGMLKSLTDKGQRGLETIAEYLPKYNKVTNRETGQKEFVQGLQNRRDAELGLFNTPMGEQPAQQEAPAEEAPQPQAQFQGQTQSPIQPASMREVPQDVDAGFQFGFSDAISSMLQPPGQVPMMHAPIPQFKGQPEYIPSVAQGGVSTMSQAPMQPMLPEEDYNMGGPVYLNNGGGWFSWLFDRDKQQQFGNALGNRPGIRPNNQPNNSNLPPPPPETTPNHIPNSDEALLTGSSQQMANVPDITKTTQSVMSMDPEAQEAWFEANPDQVDAVLAEEERLYKLKEGLNQNRINQSVAASDAPGLPFLQQQEQSLISAMSGNPVQPGYEDGMVPLPTAPGQEDDPFNPNAQGYAQMPQGFRDELPSVNTDAPVPLLNNPAGMQQNVETLRNPVTGELSMAPGSEIDELGINSTAPQGPALDTPESAPDIDKKSAVNEVVSKLDAEDVADTSTPTSKQIVKDAGGSSAIEAAGNNAMRADPKQMGGIKDTIKSAFGDLFDGKELARAAIMYLGARATGMSGGQALAFAGRGYIGRLDAAAANKSKIRTDLIKGGKYTTKSIKSFMDTDDPSQLVPVKSTAPIVGTGEFKTFYGPGGKKQNAQKFKVGEGQYVWQTEDGRQVNAQWNTDASAVPGTKEYSDRVKSDSGQYIDMIKGLRSANSRKLDKYGNVEYATDLVPELAGRDVTKWALENNVDPDLMGGILQNAYDAAAADQAGGKSVKNITPYLNDQYVKATVGDAELFKTSNGQSMSADKINNLIGGMAKMAMDSGKLGSSSEAATKKIIVSHFQKQWNELDDDVKARYENQANNNESGFYVFVRKQSMQ